MLKLKNKMPITMEDNEEKMITIESPRFESAPQGNRIYFYGEVNKETVLNLNRQIDDVSKSMKMIQFSNNLPYPPAIEIHICSDGGDVLAAMACVDKIINSQVPIHTYCEGVVASCATLLSVVGHRRFITKHSCMLIHQVSSGLWGNYAQFKDEIKNLNLIMGLIKSVYLKRTKMTSSILDDILVHDVFFNSKESLKFGLVDEIL